MDFHVLGVPPESFKAFVIGCPLEATASVFVNVTNDSSNSTRQVLLVALDSISCSPVKVLETSVGAVNVDDFSSLIGIVMSLLKPEVNKIMSNGFPLPQVGDFSISESVLESAPGVLQVSTNINLG